MLMAEAQENELSYLRLAIACKISGTVSLIFDRTFQLPCTHCTPNNRRITAALMAANATGFRLIVDSALRDETAEEVRVWEAGRTSSECVCERLRRAGQRARKPNAEEKKALDAQLGHLVRMDGVSLAPKPPQPSAK